jgi:hypothetical protein
MIKPSIKSLEVKIDENFEIPEWQKAVVMARFKDSREFPERLILIKNAEERLSKLRGF